MITRRGLLQGILAAGLTPAIGRAGIIMPPRHVIAPPQEIVITGTTTISNLFNDNTVTIEEYMASQVVDRVVLRQVGHYEQLLKGHA
jgi:hypothetical protein